MPCTMMLLAAPGPCEVPACKKFKYFPQQGQLENVATHKPMTGTAYRCHDEALALVCLVTRF
eukprot:6208060-Pleurochrysis_carterae.AAC.3